jgi:hypothetical protein
MERDHGAEGGRHIWRYGNIDVIYEPALDGGMKMAPPLIAFSDGSVRIGASARCSNGVPGRDLSA